MAFTKALLTDSSIKVGLTMSIKKILKALEFCAINPSDENTEDQSTFYAEETLNLSDLSITVDGIGSLTFPLSLDEVLRLKALGYPAKFGRGEQTILDKEVRDTAEIAVDLLAVTYNEENFFAFLAKIRDQLGLPDKARLTAHLHNLLIYGPGQFFKPHQDSEKLNGMVATLVIVLPSPHIGGDLVITQKKEKHRFSSQHLTADNLRCVAFYSDCLHEAEPVIQGERVALTYNLVLEPAADDLLEDLDHPELETDLKAYFRKDSADESPNFFAYLLDHSYTEHSARFLLLKGKDSARALTLRYSAKKLGLIPHLALVDIHESWSTDEDYGYSRKRRYYQNTEEEYDLVELIEGSITFSTWFNDQGEKLPYGDLRIDESQICWTRETKEFEPENVEHEGWMGNYGNTADYWYRRTAVVLWRASDQLILDFRLNYEAALKALLLLTEKPGHEQQVIDTLKRVISYVVREEDQRLKNLATLAGYIRDPDIALSLVSHIKLTSLELYGPELIQLQNTYGLAWLLTVLPVWKSKTMSYGRRDLIKNIGALVKALVEGGTDIKISLFLLHYQFEVIMESDKSTLSGSPSQRTKDAQEKIFRMNDLLQGYWTLQEANLYHKAIQHIISHKDSYPFLELVDNLAPFLGTPTQAEIYGVTALRHYIRDNLQQELARGLRSPNDWSIQTPLGCKCDWCKTATAFLQDSTEAKRVWPVVQDGRNHIHNIFDRLELPVDLSVEKKGSPHKLVMVKTSRLYTDAKARFDKIEDAYRHLKD